MGLEKSLTYHQPFCINNHNLTPFSLIKYGLSNGLHGNQIKINNRIHAM